MEEVDGGEQEAGEQALTSWQVSTATKWPGLGPLYLHDGALCLHSSSTPPASKQERRWLWHQRTTQQQGLLLVLTQAQLFTAAALSPATAAALQACFLSTGEASKPGNAGQGALEKQSLTLPVFLSCCWPLHRIYSALNALGLYNKNAKILFLVSSGVGPCEGLQQGR